MHTLELVIFINLALSSNINDELQKNTHYRF